MSELLTDVLAALSVGQSLTAAGSRFEKSQSWRYALEQAHAQNQWVGQVSPQSEGGATKTSAGVSETPIQPSAPSQESSSSRLNSARQHAPRLAHASAEAGNVEAKAALSNLAPRSPAANPWHGQSAPRFSTPATNSVPLARPVAPPTRPTFFSAHPLPRSVNLIAVNGQVQVVIRDEALTGQILPKLVARIREFMASQGEELVSITVNGAEVWRDPAQPALSLDDGAPPAIEVLF